MQGLLQHEWATACLLSRAPGLTLGFQSFRGTRESLPPRGGFPRKGEWGEEENTWWDPGPQRQVDIDFRQMTKTLFTLLREEQPG